MFGDDEKTATDVTKGSTSDSAAKNAGKGAEASAPAPGATSSPAPAPETSVSTISAEDLDQRIAAAVDKALEQAAHGVDSDALGKLIEEKLDTAVDNMKAELIAYVKSLFAANRPIPTMHEIADDDDEPLPFETGDRVKVFADAERKTFHKGTVTAVHGDGHAYDIVLDDGGATMVPAGGVGELVE